MGLRHWIGLAAFAGLAACASIERLAIPAADLKGPAFTQSGSVSGVDHDAWDAFLSAYAFEDEAGVVRVRYGDVTAEDSAALDAYIDRLSDTETTGLTRDAQLAYWVNLYNAATVQVILAHYPVSSIRKIKDGFFDLGPWDEKRLTIRGEPFSLHDIEHRVVRAVWGDDPRPHYILNCAATGCPDLGLKAYRGATINAAMDEAARDYVNDPRGVQIDDKGLVTASKIYSWYLGDYGGTRRSALAHIKLYAEPTLKARLDEAETINRFVYDWSLNDGTSAR